MKKRISNIIFTKRISILGLICTVIMSSSFIAFAKAETIPATMPPGTILTYNENLVPTMTLDEHTQTMSVNSNIELNVGTQKQLIKEEAVYTRIKEETKNCAVYTLDDNLPTPTAGMVVIYGSDGQINRIYSPEAEIMPFASESITTASGCYTAEQKIEKLKEYDVIQGYEDGNFYPENKITRAEFCKIISIISGFQAEPKSEDHNYFADVPPEHWASKYIRFCHDSGLVNGVLQSEKLYFVDLDENGNEIYRSELFYKENIGELYGIQVKVPENLFEPDANITYQDALKILVCTLGYEDMAKQKGDYPDGYVLTAKKIGIIGNGFSNTDYMSRESTAEVVYNTLFTPIMIKRSISDENGDRTEYIVSDGNNGTELKTLYKLYFEKYDINN